MCTLIVLDRIAPGFPLVVASNRDEFYSRPAAPPARVDPQEEDEPVFVAPQDLEGGGTWMGINARGLFVGLTNRRAGAVHPDRRSRGLLVSSALRHPTARAVAEDMTQGLADTYSPFHLLCADGREAYLAILREAGPPARAEVRSLGPGVHVVCNRDPADPSSGKTRWLREAVLAIDPRQPLSRVLAGLRQVLRSHPDAENPLENPCVHTPDYGTRSSALMALGEDRWRYWHSEGPPCETKYANYTRLLDEIR